MLRVPETNLVFIHIPKTAGLAVRAAFGMKLDGGSSHSVDSEEDKKLVAGDYIRFCVVRDPLERFVSAYLYNVDRAERNPTGIRKLILEQKLGKDINDFVAHFAENNIPFAKYDHFKPQEHFLRLGQPQIVLKQERLAKDIKIISRLAPYQFRGLGRTNSASDQDRERKRDPGLVTELNPASMERFMDFYGLDFSTLGYSSPS